MMMQIIAMGGGGFSMEPENPLLDTYILQQARAERPRICFLSQASAESHAYIINFYRAFTQHTCQPSHLSLFQPHTADIDAYLMEQDIIYVGGGNTKSMLALWREWGLDHTLRAAAENGTVLAGISAGAICWFEWGQTDSFTGRLAPLRGLGYLAGGCVPHFDGEPLRRPALHQMIAADEMPASIALDDGAAAHYVDGRLVRIVSSRPAAKAYRVEPLDGVAVETSLDTRYLGKS